MRSGRGGDWGRAEDRQGVVGDVLADFAWVDRWSTGPGRAGLALLEKVILR